MISALGFDYLCVFTCDKSSYYSPFEIIKCLRLYTVKKNWGWGEGQNKMALWKFGNLVLKRGSLIKWGAGASLFFLLSAIIISLIYLIIWFTLHNVAWVSFLCVFLLCALSFYGHIIVEKSFLLYFWVRNFVSIVFPSEMYILWK